MIRFLKSLITVMIIILITSCFPKEKSKSESEYSKEETAINSVNPDTITEKVERTDHTVCVVNEITYDIWDMSDDVHDYSATYKIELAEGLFCTIENSVVIFEKKDLEHQSITSDLEYTFANNKSNYNTYLKFSNGSIVDGTITYIEHLDSYFGSCDTENLLKNLKVSTLTKVRIVNTIDGSNLDYEILKSKTEILRPIIKIIEKETLKSIRNNAYACKREERERQKEKDLEGF